MNTQELKEQVRKEFEEKFEHGGVIGDRTFKDYLSNTYDNILNFIDSLIDRTVQMTEERLEERLQESYEAGFKQGKLDTTA